MGTQKKAQYSRVWRSTGSIRLNNPQYRSQKQAGNGLSQRPLKAQKQQTLSNMLEDNS